MKEPWETEDLHKTRSVISAPGMAWLRVPKAELKMIKEIVLGKVELTAEPAKEKMP